MYSWATPLATGYTYNIHFNFGIDFEHIAIRPSSYFTPNDLGIVLRFNYTAVRESFSVGRLFNNSLTVNYVNIGKQPDPKTCSNGEWFNDKAQKNFYVCLSGKNKDPYEYIDINPIRCIAAGCSNGLNE